MIQYIFLGLSILSGLYAGLMNNPISFGVYIVASLAVIILILGAKENQKLDGISNKETMNIQSYVKSTFEDQAILDHKMLQRLEKLENDMSKIALGSAFGKK